MCFLLIEKVVGQAEKGDAGGITPSGTGSRVAPAAIGEFVAIHLEEGGGQSGGHRSFPEAFRGDLA
jgi:hypothetical protein